MDRSLLGCGQEDIMNSRSILSVGLVAVATAALVGCVEGEEGERGAAVPGAIEESSAARAGDLELALDEPTLLVTLESGERLSFYLDENGSAGVLGQLPMGAPWRAALDHPALQGASPAMVYFAVTGEESEIPGALLAHHEGLAREGSIPALSEAVAGKSRGWLRVAPIATAADESPCLNATFTANHCAHPDYDEAVCKLNTSGTWSWNVPGANRFKAGFCLQEGDARSWLYYRSEAADCNYFTSQNFIWGLNSYLFGDEYSATTYFTYVWWRGAGAPHRWFFHFGGEGTGDVFDWGTRYSWETCP